MIDTAHNMGKNRRKRKCRAYNRERRNLSQKKNITKEWLKEINNIVKIREAN